MRSVSVIDNRRVFNGRLAKCGTKLDTGSDFTRQIELIIAQPPTKKAVGVFCRSFLRNLRNVFCFENEAFAASACYNGDNFAVVIRKDDTRIQAYERSCAFCVYAERKLRFGNVQQRAVIFVVTVKSKVTVNNQHIAVQHFTAGNRPTSEIVLIFADLNKRKLLIGIADSRRNAVTNQKNRIFRYGRISLAPICSAGRIVSIQIEVYVACSMPRLTVGSCIACIDTLLRLHFKFCNERNLTARGLRKVEFFPNVVPAEESVCKFVVFCHRRIGSGFIHNRTHGKSTRLADNRTVVIRKRYVGVHEGYLPVECGGIRAICQVENKVNIVEYDCVLMTLRVIENTVKDKFVPVFKFLP